MKRSLLSGIGTSAALAAFIGLVVAACDDTNDQGYAYGGGGSADCSQYTSCGQCTPVPGCGWCSTPSGQGLCARDPNDCASASSFTWTWDTQGCFLPADASVVSVPPPAADAGDAGPAVTQDSGPGKPTDAGSPGDSATASDTGGPLASDASDDASSAGD